MQIKIQCPAPLIMRNKELNRFLLFSILTKVCKEGRRVFYIRFFLEKRQKLAKKNTGQCSCIESKATCKNSADLDKNKKKALKFTWVGYALNPSIVELIQCFFLTMSYCNFYLTVQLYQSLVLF